MPAFTDSVVEQAALAWLETAGWRVAYCPDIAPNELSADRHDNGGAMLSQWRSRAFNPSPR
jgi:type I restriction enzyme R subunit